MASYSGGHSRGSGALGKLMGAHKALLGGVGRLLGALGRLLGSWPDWVGRAASGTPKILKSNTRSSISGKLTRRRWRFVCTRGHLLTKSSVWRRRNERRTARRDWHHTTNYPNPYSPELFGENSVVSHCFRTCCFLCSHNRHPA